MTQQRSAYPLRAAALAVTVLALLAVVVPAWSAPAATPATSAPLPASLPELAVSLLASSPTVPTGGTFGYTAEVRVMKQTSYLQAVLEVFHPSGQLLFKRTRVANDVQPGAVRFNFERELADVLALEPDGYPVRLTVSADIDGSTVTTETTSTLRVYSKNGPRVRIAIVARVTGQPMSSPDGRFVIDPALATGARDAVGVISRRVLADPAARVTLAVPPVLLAEWRRLSGGYTLANGTVVRPVDPVPVAYNSTLADLTAAIDTTRLELVALGYADPNLTDLANHGLAEDIGPQYDAGISAMFASLEVTPSVGSAPADGCVPPNAVGTLAAKGIRYVIVDSECVRHGKSSPDSGVYAVANEKLLALVAEPAVAAALSSGDQSEALNRSFTRLTHAAKEPLVMRVDIDGDTFMATDTVGAALSAFELQPWMQLVNARALRPASGAGKVRLLAGRSTPNAPKGFWNTVAQSRGYADAYYAAVGAGDPEATVASQQSLVAESSAWVGPDGLWRGAARGIGFAEASIKTTKAVLDGVSLKVEPITLSASTGDFPIIIANATEKTLNVVVHVTSSGGLRLGANTSIPTTLPPQETYLVVPVDMSTSLSGKLTVEVSSAGLVLSRKTVTVRGSYLDRLALGGAVIVALLGMLVFIVRRTRAAETREGDSNSRAGYTGADDDDVRRSSR